MFTIYSADVTGNPGNCSYPHKHVILDEASLKEGIRHDYVCAEYRNSYRNGDNFIGSDCLPVDCDNDHTEDPAGWKTPEDVMEAFPGVTFAIHYSRFHMREKNGKPARPKFHVLFPIDYITDAALYSDMKRLVNSIFPYFDTKALDAARFFFGTSAADIAIYPGRMNLTEFLEEDAFDDDLPDGQYDGNTVIPEGSRNATMSRFAGRVIKKYGDTDEAYQAFMDEAAKCVPPLEASELSTIWHSAQRFFARIRQQDGYVPPEVYNDPASYKPEDYSDVGQAEVLSKYFSKELRYSPATHFIRYSDHYWQESEPGAQAVAHELTRRQMKEAGRDLLSALEKMKNSGAQTILDGTTKSKAREYQAKMEDYMKALGLKTLTIQGELCAPGIQQNRLRLAKPEWYVFTIRENGKRVGLKRMLQICEALDITPVPIEEVDTDLPSKYPTVDALLARADGEYPNGGKKEGIVIRPTEPVFCPLISASLSMKVVSNKYLLKNDG